MELPGGHQFLTAVNCNCKNTNGIVIRSCGARGEELRLMSADQCSTLRGEWRVNTEALQVQPRYNIRYKLLCLPCLRNTYTYNIIGIFSMVPWNRRALQDTHIISNHKSYCSSDCKSNNNDAQWMVSTGLSPSLLPSAPSIIICYHGLSVVSVC